MISAELLAEQLALTSHINIITSRELVRAWLSMGVESRSSETLFPTLMNVITEIATAYGEVAAISAADFYDEVREAAGVSGRAAVPASAVPPTEQVKAIVGWGLAPMREDIPRPDAAMERLMGATSRLSLQPGRYTTYGMVKRDHGKYAHVPQGKSCAFCMMLASRGAVYWSSQPHYHSNCDCVSIPVFSDDDLPEINQTLHDEWQNATWGQRDQTKAWREYVSTTYGVTH